MKPAAQATLASAPMAVRRLAIATLTLACAAPVITRLSRIDGMRFDFYLVFERLFAFNDHLQSLAMLAALLVALACRPARDATARLAAWMGEHPLSTAGLAFFGLALGALFICRAHPLSMDEYVPWMQAHAFAKGRGVLHYPPELLDLIVPPSFQGSFVLVDHTSGAATSVYWPGMALLFTPLVAFNLGWCLNPAFGALTLLLLHRLTSDAAGDTRAGGWAMLAALASPQFTVSAMTWYAMPGELALNLLFLWLLLKPRLTHAFAAGLVGGLCLIMHNPVPHALMAAPCLAWLLLDRARWLRLLGVLAGYVPLGLGVGIGWWLLKSGFGDAAAGASTAMGVVDMLGRVFVWPDSDVLAARWQATWKIWIWACPGLLLLPLLPRPRPLVERLLLAAFVLTFVFYLFVRFDQGHGWGYRYIHPVWGALPVVAGLWLARAEAWPQQWGRVILAAGLLATPVFLWQTQASVDRTLSFRFEPEGAGDWVVFVSQATGYYRGDLVQNADSPSQRLVLISHGERADRTLMARHFPTAAEVMKDSRGSAWRLPAGSLSTTPHPQR
ncbi:hypothetical protein [Roseateles sp.]|uniref:hypothetical protein n=1 Tax=Roseateles sp. TaxID=1971397 RepID=UPI003263DD8B